MSRRLFGSFLILATLSALYLAAGLPWTLNRVWIAVENSIEASTPLTLERGRLRGNLFTGLEVRNLRASGLEQSLEVPVLRVFLDWGSLLSGRPRIDARLESPVARLDLDRLDRPVLGESPGAPDTLGFPVRPGRLTVVRGRVDLQGGQLPLPPLAIFELNLDLRPRGAGFFTRGVFAARALGQTTNLGFEASFDQAVGTYRASVRGVPAMWMAEAGAEATFGQLRIRGGRFDLTASRGPGGAGVEVEFRDLAATYVIGMPLERGAGRVTWDGALVRGRLEGLVNGSSASVQATVDPAAQNFQVTGETVTDLAAAMRLWSLPLPAAGRARVEVLVSGWERVRVEGRVNGVEATFLGLPVTNLSAGFEALIPRGEPGDDRVFFQATATYLGGALTARGEAIPDWWAEIGFDQAVAGPATLTGRARVEDQGQGLILAARSEIAGPDFWPLQGTVTVSPGLWPPVAEVRLGLGEGSLSADVILDGVGPTGEWLATNLPAPNPFEATLQGKGSIAGPFHAVELTADLTTTPVQVAGFATPPLAGRIAGVFSGAERVQVAADFGAVTFQGDVHLADQRWELTGSADPLSLPQPWTGRLTGRDLTLTGKFSDPVLSGLVTGSRIGIAGVELPDLEGSASLAVAAGPHLTFKSPALTFDLALDSWTGSISPDLTLLTPFGPHHAQGSLSGSPGSILGELTLAGPAGSVTVGGRGGPPRLAGRVDAGHLSGGWLIGHFPVQGSLLDGALNIYAAGPLSIPAAGASGQAVLQVVGPLEALEFSASLESGAGRMTAASAASGFQVKSERFPINPLGFPGVIDAEISFPSTSSIIEGLGWVHFHGLAAGVPVDLSATGDTTNIQLTGALGDWPLSGTLAIASPNHWPTGEVHFAAPEGPSRITFETLPDGGRAEYSGLVPDLVLGPVTMSGGKAAATWTPGRPTVLTAHGYGMSWQVLAGGRVTAEIDTDLGVLESRVQARGTITGEGLDSALDLELEGPGLSTARIGGSLLQPQLEVHHLDLSHWTSPLLPEGLVAGEARLLAAADLLAPGGPEARFTASVENARLSGRPVIVDLTGGVNQRDWWGSLQVAAESRRLTLQRHPGGPWLEVQAQQADLAWFSALAPLQGQATGDLILGGPGSIRSQLVADLEAAGLAAARLHVYARGEHLEAVLNGRALAGAMTATATWQLDSNLLPLAMELIASLENARADTLLPGATGTMSAEVSLAGPGWLANGTANLRTRGLGFGPLALADREETLEVVSSSLLELRGDHLRGTLEEWSVTWPAQLSGNAATLNSTSGSGQTTVTLDAPGVARAGLIAQAGVWRADGRILALDRLGLPGPLTGTAELSAHGANRELRANALLRGTELAGEPLDLTLDLSAGEAGWTWQVRGALAGSPLAVTAKGPNPTPSRVTIEATRIPAGPLAALAGLPGVTGEVSSAGSFDLGPGGPSGWRGWLDLQASAGGIEVRGRADADGRQATATLQAAVAGVSASLTGEIWPQTRKAGLISGAIVGRAALRSRPQGPELVLSGTAGDRPLDLKVNLAGDLSGGGLTLQWGALAAELAASASSGWRPTGTLSLGDASQLLPSAGGGIQARASWTSGEWRGSISGRRLTLLGVPAALEGALAWPASSLEGGLTLTQGGSSLEVSGRIQPDPQLLGRAQGLPLAWFSGLNGTFDGQATLSGPVLAASGLLSGLDLGLPDLQMDYSADLSGQSISLGGSDFKAWAVARPGLPDLLLEPLRGGLEMNRRLMAPGGGRASLGGHLEYQTGAWTGSIDAVICDLAGIPPRTCIQASLAGANAALEVSALLAESPLGAARLSGVLGGDLFNPRLEGRLNVEGLGGGPLRADLHGAEARLTSAGSDLDIDVAFASGAWTALWRGQKGLPPLLPALLPGATGALTGLITAGGRLDLDPPVDRVDASVTGTLTLAGIEVEIKAGSARYEAGRISAGNLRLAVAGLPASIDGRLPEGIRLVVDGARTDHLGLPGTLTLGGRITGQGANLKIEAGGQVHSDLGSLTAAATGSLSALSITVAGEGRGPLAGLRLSGIGGLGPNGWSGGFDASGTLPAGQVTSRLELSGPSGSPRLSGPVKFLPVTADVAALEGRLSAALAPRPAAHFDGRVTGVSWLGGASLVAVAQAGPGELRLGLAGEGLLAEATWNITGGFDLHRPVRASLDLDTGLGLADWTVAAKGRLRSDQGVTSGRVDLTADHTGGLVLGVAGSIIGAGDHLAVAVHSHAGPGRALARARLGNTILTGDLGADLEANLDIELDLGALGLGPGRLKVSGPVAGALGVPQASLDARLDTPGAPNLAGSLDLESGLTRLVLSDPEQSLAATVAWATGLASGTWTGSGADARPLLGRVLPGLSGTASGRIEARASLAEPTGALRLEGSLAGEFLAADLPITLDPGSSFSYSGGRLHLPRATGRLLGGRFQAGGAVSSSESLLVHLEGLDPIGDPLAGPWSGELRVSGPLDKAGLHLQASGASGQRVEGRATLTPTGLALEGQYHRPDPDLGVQVRGALTSQGLALQLAGSRAIAGSTGEFTVSPAGLISGGARLRVEDLEAVAEVLWLDASGDLLVTGSVAEPQASGDLGLRATLLGSQLPPARLTGDWSVDQFWAAMSGENFDLRASRPPGHEVLFDADLRGLAWADLSVSGRAAGRLDGHGLSGDLALALVTPPGPGWLAGSGLGGKPRVSSPSEPGGGQVEFEATLSSSGWRGSLIATDLQLAPEFGPVDLRAVLDGATDAPRLDGHWTGRTLFFPAQGTLGVSLAGAEVSAEIDLGGEAVHLSANGLWREWPVVQGQVWVASAAPVRSSGRLQISGGITDPELTGELRWRGPDETATLAVNGRLSEIQASGSLHRGGLAAEGSVDRRPGEIRVTATATSPAGSSRLLAHLGERGGEITARLNGLDLSALIPGLGGVVTASADLVVGADGTPTGSARLHATGLDLPGLPLIEGADRLRGAATASWTGEAGGWTAELDLQTEPAAARFQAAAGASREIQVTGQLRLAAGGASFSAGISQGRWEAQADGGELAISLAGIPVRVDSLQIRGERLEAQGSVLGGRLSMAMNGLSGLVPADLAEWAGLARSAPQLQLTAQGVDLARVPSVAELGLPVSGRLNLSGRLEGPALIIEGWGEGLAVGKTELAVSITGSIEGSRASGAVRLGESAFEFNYRAGRVEVQGVMRGLPLDPAAQVLIGRPGFAVLATGALRAELLLADLQGSTGHLAIERLTVVSTGATLTGSGGVSFSDRTWTVEDLALGGAGSVRASGRFGPDGFRVELDAEGDVLGPVVALLIGDQVRPLDRGGRLALRAWGTPSDPQGTIEASDLTLTLAGSEVTLRTLAGNVAGGLISAGGQVVASGVIAGEARLDLTARLADAPGLLLDNARVGLEGWAEAPVIGRASALRAEAELIEGSWRIAATLSRGGTLTLLGRVTPSIDLTLSGEGIHLSDPNRFVQAGVGDVALRLIEEAGVPVLRGAVTVTEMDVAIPALTAAPPVDERPLVLDLDPDPTRGGPFAGLRFDNLRIIAARNIRLHSAPLTADFSGDLTVAGTASDPRLSGGLSVIRGSISLNQYRFNIDEGRIQFTPADGLYPSFQVRGSGAARLPVERPKTLTGDGSAATETTPVTQPVSLRLAGWGRFVPAAEGGRRLETSFALTSDPPLALDPKVAEARLLSAVLFGSPEGLDLTRLPGVVVETLFEYVLVRGLERDLAAAAGLDLFEFRTDLLERIQRADGKIPLVQFTFGKYLSDQIFITYRLAFGPDGTRQDLGLEFNVERAFLRMATELDFTTATLPWQISLGYLLDETTTLNLALGDRLGQTTIRFGLQFRY